MYVNLLPHTTGQYNPYTSKARMLKMMHDESITAEEVAKQYRNVYNNEIYLGDGFPLFYLRSIGVLGGMMVVFVCLLYIIFILLDHEKLSASWPTLIPIDYRERAKMMMRDLDQSMNAYFRGQALVAGIVGILFAIGFLGSTWL